MLDSVAFKVNVNCDSHAEIVCIKLSGGSVVTNSQAEADDDDEELEVDDVEVVDDPEDVEDVVEVRDFEEGVTEAEADKGGNSPVGTSGGRGTPGGTITTGIPARGMFVAQIGLPQPQVSTVWTGVPTQV